VDIEQTKICPYTPFKKYINLYIKNISNYLFPFTWMDVKKHGQYKQVGSLLGAPPTSTDIGDSQRTLFLKIKNLAHD
jgi:hypothetical protein